MRLLISILFIFFGTAYIYIGYQIKSSYIDLNQLKELFTFANHSTSYVDITLLLGAFQIIIGVIISFSRKNKRL